MAADAKTAQALYALGIIEHDGKRFEAGDKLPAMAPEAAEALRAAGVVSAAPPSPTPRRPEVPYGTQADMLARFGADELRQLTDLALPQQGVIVAAVLDNAIGDAGACIDSHLGARYAVPLTGTLPPGLVRVACDLARFFLHNLSVPEPVRERYDDGMRWLRDVAGGKLPLVGADGSVLAGRTEPYASSVSLVGYPAGATFGAGFAAAWRP